MRIVHSSRGRLRVHLPTWSGHGERQLESNLCQLPGVVSTQASSLTGNILLVFDPDLTSPDSLLSRLPTVSWATRPTSPSTPIPERVSSPRPQLEPQPAAHQDPTTTQAPPVLTEGEGHEQRARIAARGLDRHPGLARRVVQLLHRKHGVRAQVKPITGYVHVEYDKQKIDLGSIIAELARLELPALPGEDRPEHPLDSGPVVESVARIVLSVAGLGVVTFRRLRTPGMSGFGMAGIVAGLLNLAKGVPFIQKRFRRLLGKQTADVIWFGLDFFALTLADFPLGLIVAGIEAMMLWGEVTARRRAWLRYEDNLVGSEVAEPGVEVRFEAGRTVPRLAVVVEGVGTMTSGSGLPVAIVPGTLVPAGGILYGGPFVLEFQGGQAFEPRPRPCPQPPSLYYRYLRYGSLIGLGYAAFNGLRTVSFTRMFESLLLLNPRPAVIAHDSANLAAAARALRSGLTVVGTRPDRPIRLPTVLLLDNPRMVTDGLEIAQVLPLADGLDADEVVNLAATINLAAHSPWGHPFQRTRRPQMSDGTFNGLWAAATVDGIRYTLGPPEDELPVSDSFIEQHAGGYLLALQRFEDGALLGLVALRPRLADDVLGLSRTCKRLGVRLELLAQSRVRTAGAIAERAGLTAVPTNHAVEAIRRLQEEGALVAFASDSADAGAAFAACDLAVGVAAASNGEFPARADLLSPDLRGLSDLLETAARRDLAVRDGVFLSAASNAAGALLGLTPAPLGTERATLVVYVAALATMTCGWLRLRAGHRPQSTLAFLADPHPERWGRRDLAEAFASFNTGADGLGAAEAASRRLPQSSAFGDYTLMHALRNQLRTPITSLLAGGACLTLVLGQPLNTSLIAFTVSLNIVAGIWQEREVGKASEALKRMCAANTRVLRDGRAVSIPQPELVPGDILVLGPGDRIAADARMVTSTGLEVDEAALTGESLPVPKGPDGTGDSDRIVLEGSDVVVGTGRAVVVGVGRRTRLGATAAALNVDRSDESPMGNRLGKILHIALPVAGIGGMLTAAAGFLYGGAAANMLTIGVTTALSAIPEGLPLLSGVGQAAVARRLAKRGALVRRIAAIEALGRVDVACSDKTGTMTEGRLAVRLLADDTREISLPGSATPELSHMLLTAAVASPHPHVRDAVSHPTDRAVVRAALEAGLEHAVLAPRRAEVAFDSARAFHASLVDDRVCVKGAPERLIPRCAYSRQGPLDEHGRAALLARAARLAERGLRVLMVAEGPPDADPDNPQELTALGFVGISDPIRPTVPEAVRRCQAAGIHVIMLTGDHPATARAIAQEAGLIGEPVAPGSKDRPRPTEVVRAADLMQLPALELDRQLERIAVVARATPMDKLQIIQSLRRRGHIVAMTGDGVNDAPSLRLADVGVAMGRGGTEVARQAADVVLVDDDFATLVEALVEGRGFWRNMRTALGLLLGGNAGELGVVAGASSMGFGSPLSAVQILIVNMITDALPSLAVVLQRPEHRRLADLAREGLSALDRGLRRDTFRRGVATAIPSLAAYLIMHALQGPQQASAAAFTGVVATQLAQTLDAGRVQGAISGSVIKAVGVSVALLVSTVSLPPLRNFLGLISPTPLGWGVVGASSAAAVAISRVITALEKELKTT